MSQDTLERIEAELKSLRALVEEQRGEGRQNLKCLTVEDAARHLGVSPSTIKRMIKSGELLTATVNKRALVPMSELARVATPDPKRPAQQKAAKAAAWVPFMKKRAPRLGH